MTIKIEEEQFNLHQSLLHPLPGVPETKTSNDTSTNRFQHHICS